MKKTEYYNVNYAFKKSGEEGNIPKKATSAKKAAQMAIESAMSCLGKEIEILRVTKFGPPIFSQKIGPNITEEQKIKDEKKI